jgi:hypothetical protein
MFLHRGAESTLGTMDARPGLLPSLTRRTLLRSAGALAALGSLGGAAPALAAAETQADALDEALLRLTAFGPAYAGGLANHGPMVAEALVALGRADAIPAWTDRYARRLEPWPRSGGRIVGDAWADALGRSERASDWRALFEAELAAKPARDVLATWLPRLAPGISGSAAHGLIRVSHVVRALSARDSAPRRAELAAGLAYWAASYHALPDEPKASVAGSGLSVEQAIRRLDVLPEERRVEGSIVNRLGRLRELPSFAHAADLVDVSGEPGRVLSDVARAFARVYVDNAGQRDGVIARLHALTGASAVRPILPYLPADAQRPVVRYTWQLAAAVYATHAQRDARAPAIEPFASRDELVARAVDTGDEHAVKLTEVCLREAALADDPMFALAAAHWVRDRS